MEKTEKNSSLPILLCKIQSAHGLRGQVKIKTFTENPESITSYGDIFDKSGRKYKIKIQKIIGPDHIIASIDGVFDRNASEKIKGLELFIQRNSLPELPNGQYYETDLMGLEVRNLKTGEKFGIIEGFHNFGAGLIIEIMRESDKKSEMYIFNQDNFPEIIAQKGYIVINPPEEIWDKES